MYPLQRRALPPVCRASTSREVRREQVYIRTIRSSPLTSAHKASYAQVERKTYRSEEQESLNWPQAPQKNTKLLNMFKICFCFEATHNRPILSLVLYFSYALNIRARLVQPHNFAFCAVSFVSGLR